MQVHSKQLGGKLVHEIGKEENEPEGDNRKKNTCDIWKTLLSVSHMVPETPHCSATTYSKIHDQPSSPRKSTERMRLPAFPMAESSVMELHFLILLLKKAARG